jgi:glutaminyl-peptide cyclotransferase
MILRVVLIILASGVFTGCNGNLGRKADPEVPENAIAVINYTYVKTYPHDTTSFTEGLVIHNGELYESTGASLDLPQTRSLFGQVDLMTGKINVRVEIDAQKYFGEGIVFLSGKVYQLTYKTRVGFIYDAQTFKQIGQFNIPSKEGWGLTTNGTDLIMSDGTNILTFLNPKDLHVTKKISVTENGSAKFNLNELEYFNSSIYANVWGTSKIVRINPENGNIIGELDLTPFAVDAESIYPGSQEMNGIAYDSALNRVFVTGKLWPKIYEIRISR